MRGSRLPRVKMEKIYALYERLTPAFTRSMLRPLIHSPATLRQFLVYLGIQGIAMTVDFSVLAAALRIGVPVLVAVPFALAIALALHFLLNRHYNFRNFDRPLLRQAGTYLVLAVMMSAFAVLWVEALSQWFGVPVLIAKLLSMPITAVLGYITTRDLTFGPGIVHSIRSKFSKL